MTTSARDSAMHPDPGTDTFANPSPASPERLASIDAYRGLVMFLMMAEVLRFARWPADAR